MITVGQLRCRGLRICVDLERVNITMTHATILGRYILKTCTVYSVFNLAVYSVFFRHGRSTTDQVTLLTDDIEAGFEHNQKVGVALVYLTAAYDTVWLRGLHLKLLRMLPDRHMVSFVMELLTNRSFTLRTSDGQVSRLRRIHNGVPQGSTLAPTLFNIYISDIPKTTSKQYGYADDLALLAAHKTWEKVKGDSEPRHAVSIRVPQPLASETEHC